MVIREEHSDLVEHGGIYIGSAKDLSSHSSLKIGVFGLSTRFFTIERELKNDLHVRGKNIIYTYWHVKTKYNL